MFLCLFVWVFSSHSRVFYSFGDVTIACEGLQVLTFARLSWPLSSEGSLACHTYCDRGHRFRASVRTRDTHLLPSVRQWSCHYLFLQFKCVAAGIQTPNLPLSSGHVKQGLMSWWVWHNEDPSLLKDHKL